MGDIVREVSPKRTLAGKDAKEILAQNRMILEINAKILDEIFPERMHIDTKCILSKEDILKHTGPDSQL